MYELTSLDVFQGVFNSKILMTATTIYSDYFDIYDPLNHVYLKQFHFYSNTPVKIPNVNSMIDQ